MNLQLNSFFVVLILNKEKSCFSQRGWKQQNSLLCLSLQDAIASFTRELTGMKDSQKFLQQSLSSVLPGEFEHLRILIVFLLSFIHFFPDLLEIIWGWYDLAMAQMFDTSSNWWLDTQHDQIEWFQTLCHGDLVAHGRCKAAKFLRAKLSGKSCLRRCRKDGPSLIWLSDMKKCFYWRESCDFDYVLAIFLIEHELIHPFTWTWLDMLVAFFPGKWAYDRWGKDSPVSKVPVPLRIGRGSWNRPALWRSELIGVSNRTSIQNITWNTLFSLNQTIHGGPTPQKPWYMITCKCFAALSSEVLAQNFCTVVWSSSFGRILQVQGSIVEDEHENFS